MLFNPKKKWESSLNTSLCQLFSVKLVTFSVIGLREGQISYICVQKVSQEREFLLYLFIFFSLKSDIIFCRKKAQAA